MLPRFLRPIHHSSTRSYSLFSKPPGGRFFNSSKPPKVVPPATASAKSPTRVDASSANGDTQQQQSSSLPDDPSTTTATPPSNATPAAPALPTPSTAPIALASHPPLSAPDLRLHQFFSQHRPLVLSQPATTLFDSCPTLALNPSPPHGSTITNTILASVPQGTLEDPPETTPEADADTARLLARTLAMNAVSSAVSWDATLRRLGLQPAENTAAALGSQGLTIELDSTKRKRRKKMKKHKFVNCSFAHFLS
ncbi:hypothetical protein BJV77DRAFT_644378 [Russula vinacea]|nr:hypothetical protein BJV77DRAFT_644378 [Russula vinacea]